MLNRLPDRGSDTARSVGSFQSMQAALGRAAGYNGSWHDDEGTRLTIRQDDEGKNIPASYALQYQDKEGNWKNVPVVNRWPEPKQMELPFENRPSS